MFAASCCSSSGRSGRSTPDFLIYVALWNNSIGTMHSRSLLGIYPITIIYAKWALIFIFHRPLEKLVV